MPISVVILTLDSEASIASTLAAAMRVSDDVHVVDSGSKDGTIRIAEQMGARVVVHPLESYGVQRNWAIDHLPLRCEWELHLDADERLSEPLIEAIRCVEEAPLAEQVVGYFVPRLVHFLGRPIRHGGMYPVWHMRLFRRGRGRCEERRYDQHFVVDGPTARLPYPIIDDVRMPLVEWVARHNRWADAEADEILRGPDRGTVVPGRLRGNPIERKRALRASFERLPLFLRAFLLFLYRYVFRLGFLDGRPGLVFFVLQTFWFRFLVDAKLYERRCRRTVVRPGATPIPAGDNLTPCVRDGA